MRVSRRKRNKDYEELQHRLQRSYMKHIFNCCKLINSQGDNTAYLGDYIVSNCRDLSAVWSTLNMGEPPSSVQMQDIALIHRHVLDGCPQLPTPRFSGKPKQVEAWICEYMRMSGADSLIVAYHEGIPLEDLVA